MPPCASVRVPMLGGATFAPTAVTFDAGTNLAVFTFASPLPDGAYAAVIPAGAVADPSGNVMGGLSAPLRVLRGDANDDGAVDFNDLVVLAQHYNVPGGMTWTDGDFDADGDVDFEDLVSLTQRYNPVAAPAPVAAAFSTTRVTTPAPAAKRPVTKSAAAAVTRPVAARTPAPSTRAAATPAKATAPRG